MTALQGCEAVTDCYIACLPTGSRSLHLYLEMKKGQQKEHAYTLSDFSQKHNNNCIETQLNYVGPSLLLRFVAWGASGKLACGGFCLELVCFLFLVSAG